MKLVDLLVKELFRWPECVTYFVQDGNGDVKAGSGSKLREPLASRIWIRHTPLDSFNFYSGLCTDWKTSIVTKDIYTKHKEETQMKQIIVNVYGLTIEEKQRVNEALAKIQNVPKIGNVTTDMEWFYAPCCLGLQVGWNSILKSETPTHTPQQVLEMAGMSPAADQHVFLADTLIITDSSGSVIYDSTLKEKKKGHVHAELMAQYAEDAKTHAEPWKLWRFRGSNGDWHNLYGQPMWTNIIEYRRKPKTHFVHGVEVPDLRVLPKHSDSYWCPDPTSRQYVRVFDNWCTLHDLHREESWLCYEFTEEGKQAAILHAKAMLDLA